MDASAASWADDFQRQQQQGQNHHQQHQGGGSSSWADEFQGRATAAAAQAQGMSAPAADWADQFAQGVANLNLDQNVEGMQAAWNQVSVSCGACGNVKVALTSFVAVHSASQATHLMYVHLGVRNPMVVVSANLWEA